MSNLPESTVIQTEFGPYTVRYHHLSGIDFASFVYGDITEGTPIVRIHSACLFGEAFHSLHCDCSHQLTETMKRIQEGGAGVIVYGYQEGRGVGLAKKIVAMEFERTTGCDTIEAYKKLGLSDSDVRDFIQEAEILKGLGLSKLVRSFSGNPRKHAALERAGFSIVEELEIPSHLLGPLATKEKKVKKEKMGYTYKNE